MIVQKPGRGAWPLRLAKRRRPVGREAAAPAFSHCSQATEKDQAAHGHLAPDAEEYERTLLDAFDSAVTESRAAIQV